MMDAFAAGPNFSTQVQDSAALVQEVASLVVILYESGALDDAADLDAIVTSLEELLEDNGDFEEGCDLENDILSEADEDGAHECPTALPEDETYDDDLDFAWERGPYDSNRVARFNDEPDGDLGFLHLAKCGSRH